MQGLRALSLVLALVLVSGVPEPHTLPAGFAPHQAWQCCPPSGLILDFAAWCVDPINDAVQIFSFIRHRDLVFATTCGGAVIFSTLFGCILLVPPWTAIKESIAQGFPTDDWRALMRVEGMVEAPVTGLVAPYGMLLNPDLDWVAATSAFCGVLFSVKAISRNIYDMVDCSMQEEAVKAIVPSCKRLVVWAWRVVSVSSELSLFALSSVVLHPILICPLCFPSVLANTFSVESDRAFIFCLSLFTPGSWFAGWGSSLFLLRIREERYPAWPLLVAALFRVGACIAMVVFIDLPTGFAWLGQHSRKMGWPVLKESFVAPADALGSALLACARTLRDRASVGGIATARCEMPQIEYLSTGSALFRAALLCLAALTTALYTLGMVLLLMFNNGYRRGDQDLEFSAIVRAKQDEIKTWGKTQLERKQAAERQELLGVTPAEE